MFENLEKNLVINNSLPPDYAPSAEGASVYPPTADLTENVAAV